MENLWGEIPTIPPDLPDLPSKILKEQGTFLTEKTGGLLVGDVLQSNRDNKAFIAGLRIKVPALNDYVLGLLSVTYPLQLYPLRVETGINGKVETFSCADVDEYKKALNQVLDSEKMREIIGALLAQVSDLTVSAG